MSYNCPRCGKEIQTTAHVCDTPYTVSNCCVVNRPSLPDDIQKIVKKLEAESKKDSYYLMSPKEQRSIIEYIKIRA